MITTIFHSAFVVCGVIQIIIAVMLLRERGPSVWLMLGGSALALVGEVLFLTRLVSDSVQILLYCITLVMIMVGSLAFCVGLLLHTLSHRRRGNRVAELEETIAILQKTEVINFSK